MITARKYYGKERSRSYYLRPSTTANPFTRKRRGVGGYFPELGSVSYS
jgi:hypothetical protein